MTVLPPRLSLWGGTCVCFDKEISDSHDMLDQHGTERIDAETSDCAG